MFLHYLTNLLTIAALVHCVEGLLNQQKSVTDLNWIPQSENKASVKSNNIGGLFKFWWIRFNRIQLPTWVSIYFCAALTKQWKKRFLNVNNISIQVGFRQKKNCIKLPLTAVIAVSLRDIPFSMFWIPSSGMQGASSIWTKMSGLWSILLMSCFNIS